MKTACKYKVVYVCQRDIKGMIDWRESCDLCALASESDTSSAHSSPHLLFAEKEGMFHE